MGIVKHKLPHGSRWLGSRRGGRMVVIRPFPKERLTQNSQSLKRDLRIRIEDAVESILRRIGAQFGKRLGWVRRSGHVEMAEEVDCI